MNQTNDNMTLDNLFYSDMNKTTNFENDTNTNQACETGFEYSSFIFMLGFITWPILMLCYVGIKSLFTHPKPKYNSHRIYRNCENFV